MQDASSSSEDEDGFFGRLEDDGLFEESEAQQEKRREAQRYVAQYAQREWGLAARQQRVRGADQDSVTESELALEPGKRVVFMEKQGQQAKVWDCAQVLAKFLTNAAFFSRDFFAGKRVVELGCGIGVPGLAAAALGAQEVLLTDMAMAVPWIQANIERNRTLGNISGGVRAEALMWGPPEKHQEPPRKFDVILCSDLVYGEREISRKLVQTIARLAHAQTLVLSAHEARFAGDRGESFFAFLREQGFSVQEVAREQLHAVYSADNMHVHLIRLSSGSE